MNCRSYRFAPNLCYTASVLAACASAIICTSSSLSQIQLYIFTPFIPYFAEIVFYVGVHINEIIIIITYLFAYLTQILYNKYYFLRLCTYQRIKNHHTIMYLLYLTCNSTHWYICVIQIFTLLFQSTQSVYNKMSAQKDIFPSIVIKFRISITVSWFLHVASWTPLRVVRFYFRSEKHSYHLQHYCVESSHNCCFIHSTTQNCTVHWSVNKFVSMALVSFISRPML